MNQKGRLFLVSVVVFVVVTMVLIMNWLLFDKANGQSAAEEIGYRQASPTFNSLMNLVEIAVSQTAKAESQPNSMQIVEMAASQTAAVLLAQAGPSATLPPNIKYWFPPVIADFSPRLTYNSTQWALTDTSTLASLRVDGCTLRLAGGHALGPGWSTEESSFAVNDIALQTVLAKYQGAPQFKTYSMPNGAVFSIESASGFEQCLQDGENILKSMSVQ